MRPIFPQNQLIVTAAYRSRIRKAEFTTWMGTPMLLGLIFYAILLALACASVALTVVLVLLHAAYDATIAAFLDRHSES
jgi:hypothetical protein